MNGSIRQRSKSTWQLRFDAPPDGTGKRRYISETVHGSKAVAQRTLRDRLAAIENGGYMPRDKETVAAFMERWLVTYAASNTTLRTQEGYRGNVERYITPSIGGIVLQNLTGRHIQGVYSGMLERGLSARTTLHVHRVLRKALADAMRWGLLPRNAADAATPPRPEREQTDMWDAETIDQFLAAAEDSRFRDLYKLAVWTGMRRSELAGLKWDHVDLVTCRLSVVATLQRILGRGLVEWHPKTLRSRRFIALAPEAVELLHGVRGRQIERRLDLEDLWQNADSYSPRNWSADKIAKLITLRLSLTRFTDSVKECDEIVYISRPSVKVIISPHTVCSSEKGCHRFPPRLMSLRLLVDGSAEHRR